MRREKQYDMFDVATGACSLEDYLFQRYSENDLSSTFWIDEKDEVDELRAPKPQPDGQPGTEPEVIPIQGPRAPKKPGVSGPPPPPVGLTPDSPPGPAKTEHPPVKAAEPPVADGMDTLQKGPVQEPGGMDTVQKKQPGQPAPSLESFQASAKPAETTSSETFQAASPETGKEEASPSPKAPSMEDLLARFHQATQEYEKRSQTSDDKPEGF